MNACSEPTSRRPPELGSGQVIQTLPPDSHKRFVGGGELLHNHGQNNHAKPLELEAPAAALGDGIVARYTPPYFSEILALLEQVDAGRRRISRRFTNLLARFEQGILKPCRLVPHVKSRFPDGSPSRVYLSLTFQPRVRGHEGFRSVDPGENWHRPFTRPLTRAALHRLGELRNAEILIATRKELDRQSVQMKTLNRAALSVESRLRSYSRLPATEKPVPPMPRGMGSPRLVTFKAGAIGMAWSFANRMGRTKEDLHNLQHDHNAAKPARDISLFYSEDKEHLDGRFRWRSQPGNKCRSRLTHELLRSLGIKAPEQRLLREYDAELQRLEAKRRRYWGVIRCMKAKSQAACRRVPPSQSS